MLTPSTKLSLIALNVASLCLATYSATVTAKLGHAVSKFPDWKPTKKNNRTFTTSSLQKLFNENVKKSSDGRPEILAIEAAMEPSFRSLPKKGNGLLSHSAASFLVQKYFTQFHRYSIKGPGAEGAAKPEDIVAKIASGHEASILQAPEFVEALLEIRQAGRGLTLSDAAIMASTLQSLIDDEVMAAFDQAIVAAKPLHMFAAEDQFDMVGELSKAFHAWEYMLYYDSNDAFKSRMEKPTHRMNEFGHLAENIAKTKAYQHRNLANPFVPNVLSTVDMRTLAFEVTDQMGTWQNSECTDMKAFLTNLDPDNTGRVPLETIYEQPAKYDEEGKLVFRFAESQDALRAVGALDESRPNKPQVLISNYVLGPANCLRLQSFHTYCCINECDDIMSEIERIVQGPTTPPDFLLGFVGNLTTPSMDEPRPISDALIAKLRGIAAHHGGVVPLHGRLFAQWLHFVFPQECPYPHVIQKDIAGNSLTTSFFQQVKPGLQDPSSVVTIPEDGKTSLEMQWTDDEMMPFLDPTEPRRFEGLRTCLRVLFMGGAVVAMLTQLYSTAKQAFGSHPCDKKGNGLSAWEASMDKVA